mgnify:CR=1 FL=1
MDKFCLVSIMLFAIQRNMVNCPIVNVINEYVALTDIHGNLLYLIIQD